MFDGNIYGNTKNVTKLHVIVRCHKKVKIHVYVFVFTLFLYKSLMTVRGAQKHVLAYSNIHYTVVCDYWKHNGMPPSYILQCWGGCFIRNQLLPRKGSENKDKFERNKVVYGELARIWGTDSHVGNCLESSERRVKARLVNWLWIAGMRKETYVRLSQMAKQDGTRYGTQRKNNRRWLPMRSRRHKRHDKLLTFVHADV